MNRLNNTLLFFVCFIAFSASGQSNELLRKQLQRLVSDFDAVIGISVKNIEHGDTLTVNNTNRYPMQSVYKFPLAIAVLSEVDNGQLRLDQKIHITKDDMKPNTWSPLAKKYPEGNVDLTIEELLDYTVAKSDNNTCDILFKVMGGTSKVEKYIHGIGYKGISIKATEAEMALAIDSVEKTNWCHPYEITRLLTGFFQRSHLSVQSNDLLMHMMTASENSNNRIKGMLKDPITVAHKTGTGNRVVNDIGIITLPNGDHLALSVFVKHSRVEFEDAEQIIAKISKTIVDYFTGDIVMKSRLDAILADTSLFAFNGNVLIGRAGKPVYVKSKGYSDIGQRKRLEQKDQFVIGSISKQITAVMVLQEYDKGHLLLNEPIRKYLPELKMGWADTVTVHHLLTHMHGITAIDRPLLFTPGTAFNYGVSDIGYRLLSQIIGKVSGLTFADYSMLLFKRCGMNATFHPSHKNYTHLVKGYTEQNGRLQFDSGSFDYSPAAGGFVSTTGDLMIWNEQLHHDKLLKPHTYRLMMTIKDGAVRQHQLWGITYYGYGTTVSDQGILQIGQTGYAPGFVSMNYYFPATKTSVIVLENIAWHTDRLTETFYHHVKILNLFKRSQSK